VLAPGLVIRAEDIPPEIRSGSGRSLLPTPAAASLGALELSGADEGAVAARIPQMEFIFRTLVEMKMDLEDLRSEFERYRGRHPELTGELPFIDLEVEPIEISADDAPGTVPLHADPAPTIRLTPDMTMEEVEREAIRIALEEVGGNRRKAAERLGIGERTLYRKLKHFDLEP